MSTTSNPMSPGEAKNYEYQYVPIAQYVPAFAEVVPVETAYAIPADVMGILQAADTLSIRQHVKLLPKNCCACPPCVKQENTYSVYAGIGNNAEAEFLRIDEVSNDWNRCCCAPYHPLKLEGRQYVPMPGETGSSDAFNYGADISRDFGSFDARGKNAQMNEIYRQNPVLFSAVRDDGQRCIACPCKILDTVVCCAMCQDGVKIYSGAVEDEDPKEAGRNTTLPVSETIGSVTQPNFGGCCIPKLELFGEKAQAGTDQPFGKVEGPFCFGGWSEMCFSFKFYTSLIDSPSKTGDIGVIVKKKPASAAGALAELMTDSDNYAIEFANKSLTGAQKLTVLTSQVLIDYMLFDGNTEKCRSDRDGVTCYFFYCSIIGCLVPCKLYIPRQ